MSTYLEALEALEDYRLALFAEQQNEDVTASAEFNAQGGMSAFATALTNIHATGVGVRVRRGRILPEEFTIKVFVFEKMNLGLKTPKITGQPFQGVDIDVQHLPIQQALAVKKKKVTKKRTARKKSAKAKSSSARRSASTPANTTPAQHQARRRPVIGGLQINPLGSPFVGTLGCFVRRGTQLFALSNNHVLANTNQLPVGTPVGQPTATSPADRFAELSDFEPILFPSPSSSPRNRIDAAIAAVTDENLVQTGSMFGIPGYNPVARTPLPGMRVTKSGRTTAVTTGRIIATRVNGVRVNFGTRTNPIIATFDNCTEVQADSGSFSNPGDSGSAILDEGSGGPVSLLFAGDGINTTGCDFGEVMTRFNVVPA